MAIAAWPPTQVTPQVHVSTIFLGLDHRPWGAHGPPILFETMVFGGPLDQEQERYGTWEEAAAGHTAMVARVRWLSGLAPRPRRARCARAAWTPRRGPGARPLGGARGVCAACAPTRRSRRRRLEAAAVEVIARSFVSLLGEAPDLLRWPWTRLSYVRALPMAGWWASRCCWAARRTSGAARGRPSRPVDLRRCGRAVQAAHAWDGTGAPPGWHRHQPGGSRPPPPLDPRPCARRIRE